MICKTCKTEMKPLLYGFYCPNDCDRKPQLGWWLTGKRDGKREYAIGSQTSLLLEHTLETVKRDAARNYKPGEAFAFRVDERGVVVEHMELP